MIVKQRRSGDLDHRCSIKQVMIAWWKDIRRRNGRYWILWMILLPRQLMFFQELLWQWRVTQQCNIKHFLWRMVMYAKGFNSRTVTVYWLALLLPAKKVCDFNLRWGCRQQWPPGQRRVQSPAVVVSNSTQCRGACLRSRLVFIFPSR